jgi:hypothetical protein
MLQERYEYTLPRSGAAMLGMNWQYLAYQVLSSAGCFAGRSDQAEASGSEETAKGTNVSEASQIHLKGRRWW